VAELWQRVQTVTLDGIPYPILTPEDLLLHLCVHASYQHQFAFDLRSLWDIRQLCQAYPDLLSSSGLGAGRWSGASLPVCT